MPKMRAWTLRETAPIDATGPIRCHSRSNEILGPNRSGPVFGHRGGGRGSEVQIHPGISGFSCAKADRWQAAIEGV